ncbi:tryptophan--tRNA ligase [bacterium]|nr:tryptophan--tRNA ligase [bacterium]
MSKIILTGVTPSGSSLHVGNYFGALKPLVDLGTAGNQVYCFVSDLHALTTVQDRATLENNVKNVIINYLSCGVEAQNFVFFRQSEVAEHAQLETILTNYVGLGQMKRMHAYKDKLEKGVDTENINMGLFNYPILMAADILLYGAQGVPVGADQKQHVEIARDIAQNFNKKTGTQTLVLPEPIISDQLGRLVGTDGSRKMSKSLGNVIGIFDDYKVIEKQIMNCYTDPKRKSASDPGTVEGNPVFLYHDLWNEDKAEVAELKRRYQAGTVGDVEVKQRLLVAHKKYFAAIRARKGHFEQNPAEVAQILAVGAARARLVAAQTLAKVYKAVGLSAQFVKPEVMVSQPRPVVSFDNFARVEWRVGRVIEASEPAWSKKLIEQKVDFGPLGVRTIFSGLRAWYTAADFTGRNFVYVTNIPPRKMGDFVSEGMIVAATDEMGVPQRWEVAGAAPGTVVG